MICLTGLTESLVTSSSLLPRDGVAIVVVHLSEQLLQQSRAKQSKGG